MSESPRHVKPAAFFAEYAEKLDRTLRGANWAAIGMLADDLRACWERGHQFFICGNGGSAGNAMHMANDFLYGVAKGHGLGMRVHALSANSSVLTCLANDTGYENIFSGQLAVQGAAGDILLVLSGSGNSPNILKVLEQAKKMGVKSYAILGYTGGKAKQLADVSIHFAVDDMQISEDVQLVIGHMLMQWLWINPAPRAA